MTERPELAGYYGARAREYERIYEKPERQDDLARLRILLPGYFRAKRVLEIACGTGYWTTVVAPVARSVVAIDVAPEVLDLARAKPLPTGRVELRIGDAFALDDVPGIFDAALAGFWWSHVRREELPRFLRGLHRRLAAGARVVFFDNRYVERSSTPVARADDAGNTYQRRRLDDGTVHEVLKNFPTPGELRATVGAAGGRNVEVIELPYFWIATYEAEAAG